MLAAAPTRGATSAESLMTGSTLHILTHTHTPSAHHCPRARRMRRSESKSLTSASNCCCSQRVEGRRRNLHAPAGRTTGNESEGVRCTRQPSSGQPAMCPIPDMPARLPLPASHELLPAATAVAPAPVLAANAPVGQAQLVQARQGLNAVGEVDIMMAGSQAGQLHFRHTLQAAEAGRQGGAAVGAGAAGARG